MKKYPVLMAATLALVGGCKDKQANVEESKSGKVKVAESAIVALPMVKESEPNNKFSEANLLKLSQVGQGFIAIEGDNKSDADWWKFEVIEKSTVKIELSGIETIDLAFSLHSDRDPNEAIIKAYSNSDNDKEQLGKLGEVYPAINLDKGIYYVKVFQYKKNAKAKDLSDDKNPYNLTVTASPIVADMEAEPNERPIEAGILPVGEVRYGYCGIKNDSDWWKVEMPTEGSGPFALRVTLKAPSKVKPALFLKNDIGAVLKEVGAQKDGGETIVIPAYVIKDHTQPIFVEVHSRWTHNASEKYELKAELISLDTSFEEESNDRAVEATPITESMFIRGYIDQGKLLDAKPWRQADVDWFKLTQEEEQAIMVTLSGLEGVDLVLSLYDEEGKEEIVSVNDNDKKEGEVIAPIVIKNGLIKVSAKSSSQYNADQPYELQIRPYEDEKTPVTAGKAIEREPNNKKEQANELSLSAEGGRMGWLHPKTDVDFYSIDMSKYGAGEYKLQVTGIPVVPIKVTVTDAAGTEIAVQEKNMDKDPINLDLKLEEQKYLFKVERGGKKAASNPRDAYTISLVRGN